jgi:small subunit ribosomal protein S2
MVDTNSDPNKVDFAIPANDDASQSIAVILDHITAALQEGLNDRKAAKDKQAAEKAAEKKKEDSSAKSKAEKKEKKEESTEA